MKIIIKSYIQKDVEITLDADATVGDLNIMLTGLFKCTHKKLNILLCSNNSNIKLRLPADTSVLLGKYVTDELSLPPNDLIEFHLLVINKPVKHWLGGVIADYTADYETRLKRLGLTEKVLNEFKLKQANDIYKAPLLTRFYFDKYLWTFELAKSNDQLLVTGKECTRYLNLLASHIDRLKERKLVELKLISSSETEYEFKSDVSDSETDDIENLQFRLKGMSYDSVDAKIYILTNLSQLANNQYDVEGVINLRDIYLHLKKWINSRLVNAREREHGLDVNSDTQHVDSILLRHLDPSFHHGALRFLGKLMLPKSAKFLKETSFFKVSKNTNVEGNMEVLNNYNEL